MDDSPAPESSPPPAARRRSGRVVRKPAHLYDDIGVPGKRKRNHNDEDVDEDGDVDMEDASEDESSEEEAPDPEEVKATRKKRARKSTGAANPRAKKPKPNGDAAGVNLAIRPAKAPRAAKPRQKKAARISSAADEEGLYAEVFGKGSVLDDVAAAWLSRFNDDELEATAELLNFILKCAGCDYKLEKIDIEDEDNAANKIGDLQEQYQADNITEYPLISKARGSAVFRTNFSGFMNSLIFTLEQSGVLYENETLRMTLESWLSTLASAGNRPFRHTATFATLSIVSTLCSINQINLESLAQTRRQHEGEKKKSKNANKGRLAEMKSKAEKLEGQSQLITEYINGWYDTVFVHRYRDVDFHIRSDCMTALGDWILISPDDFLDGQYLRYLGWVLSDSHSHTRLDTIKALARIYEDKGTEGALQSFTERFRPRIVEMATRDADVAVRVASIELLDTLRGIGYLEPDDIDNVGRLIFDSEPRVRKAVVSFFVENVQDVYEAHFEDLGGSEGMEELFGSDGPEEDDFDSPRLAWLKLKSLVEIFSAYDAHDELEAEQSVPIQGTDTYVLVPGIESRFSLAAELLCDQIDELQWELLAGYLLYDHSRTRSQNGTANGINVDALFKQAVKLSDPEEVLLLEVLNAAVKLKLASAELNADRAKKPKTQRLQEQEEHEIASQHLASLIPRLLNKYGAVPEAASAVIRLAIVLDPDSQETSGYSTILEDVKKQFSVHVQPQVLEVARIALLHARSGETEEIAQGKLTTLAEETVDKLNTLAKNKDLSVRGNLSDNMLGVLESVMIRLENLSKVDDISDYLETLPADPKKKNVKPAKAAIDVLLDLVNRGAPGGDLSDDAQAKEDSIAIEAANILMFYFMWKVRALQQQVGATVVIPESSLLPLAEHRDAYFSQVTHVLRTRSGAEEIRLVLAGNMIDVYTTFSSLLRIRPATRPPPPGDGRAEAGAAQRPHEDLVTEMPKKTQAVLLHILSAAEKAFAKRSRKALEDVDEEEEPATDEEPEDSDDEDEEEESDPNFALALTLLAEKRLCEFASKLVLGIWAGVIDGKRESEGNAMVTKRLKRNRARLGPNFKGLIERLEQREPKPKRATAKKPAKAADNQPEKSTEMVVESDEEEEDADERALREAEDEREREESADANGAVEEAEVESVLGD